MPSTDLRVKELLKQNGWTTKVLSEKTGMSESYLTHLKNGTRRWNEDALKKIAGAFNLEPVQLLVNYKAPQITQEVKSPTQIEPKSKLHLNKVPVLSEIPTFPSPTNNQKLQISTGHNNEFIPVAGHFGPDLFCLLIDNQNMAPKFFKNDYLIIDPAAAVSSGDTIAIEYKTDKTHKKIATVSFSGNLVMLEAVNHRQGPIALVKGKDEFNIIGKVVYVYQQF